MDRATNYCFWRIKCTKVVWCHVMSYGRWIHLSTCPSLYNFWDYIVRKRQNRLSLELFFMAPGPLRGEKSCTFDIDWVVKNIHHICCPNRSYWHALDGNIVRAHAAKTGQKGICDQESWRSCYDPCLYQNIKGANLDWDLFSTTWNERQEQIGS